MNHEHPSGHNSAEPDGPVKVNVLFCCDSRFFQHLGVTLCSLLLSNRRHSFEVVVVCDEHNIEAQERLRAICATANNADIHFETFDRSRYEHFPVSKHISQASYLRLFATELLSPAVERVLYLDCDLVVNADLSPLWNTAMGDAFLAAAKDPFRFSHRALGFSDNDPYINAGVLLINLRRWREADVLPQFIRFIERNKSSLECHDQDVLNAVFRDQIHFLDYRWNFQARMAEARAEELNMTPVALKTLRKLPNIVHYTTNEKPWNYMHPVHYACLYFQYLKKTPWHAYVPQDRTTLNILRKAARLLTIRRQIRWVAPGLARTFRTLKALSHRPARA